MQRMAEKSEPAAVIDVLMIAKYFERIGDHATNIAEWVAFSITGRSDVLPMIMLTKGFIVMLVFIRTICLQTRR